MTLPADKAKPVDAEERGGEAAFPCVHCGASTREDFVKAAFWGKRGLIAIEDIPARVCQGCGEQFYDEKTAQRIEILVNGSISAPEREMLIPVFSLADAEMAETNDHHE